MSLRRASLGVVHTVLLLAGVDVAAAAQATWVEVRTPHFTIVSNAGEGRAREVGWQFEQFRGAIESGWPWARVQLDRPVIVIAAKDEGGMRTLLPAYFERPRDTWPSSVLVTAPDRHYIAIRSDIRGEDNAVMNPSMTAYWSYTMLTLRRAFAHDLPLWFRIGMAEVLSNTVVRDTELRFGLPIPWHISALQEGRLKLRALLEIESASTSFTDGENRRRFDAQCWALMHYLLFGRPDDLAARVNDLARRLLDGQTSSAAVEAAFGSLDALETAYIRYAQKPVFQYARMKIDANTTPKAFSSRTLAVHESRVVQAAFYAATHRPAEARGAVADARKSSPASSGSYEAEASLLDSEGKRDEALAAYVKATELGSTNGYVYYRLAALTWGTDPDEETLGRIETLLKRAVTLNDRFAPAYTLLADAVARGSQPSAALEFATKASALEPGEAAPRLALARVSWRLGRRDEARAHALAARVLADSDQERKEVQQLLDFFDRASPK